MTKICANIISQLIESENVGKVFTVNENVVVFMKGKEKFPFSDVSNIVKNELIRNIGISDASNCKLRFF